MLTPFLPTFWSPRARFLNSLQKAVGQTSLSSGTLCSFWYFVIDLPVTEWMTGAQKWGIASFPDMVERAGLKSDSNISGEVFIRQSVSHVLGVLGVWYELN